MALNSEPLIAAVACFVIGILALFGMARTRLMAIAFVGAAVVFVLAITDYMVNDSAAAFGIYTAFVFLAVMLVAFWLFTGRTTQENEPEPVVAVRRPKTTTTPTPKKTTGLYYDYRGDVHDVIDIEGIGPVYAERLQQAGVETTARLCYEDPTRISKVSKAPLKVVNQWRSMAELAKINGIGKQYAEALVRGGVEGIAELKKRSPDAIAKDVNAYLDTLDVNVLGQKVTPKRVQTWQRKAKAMRRVRQRIPTA